ncbi:MAG: 2,3-bisphosphoglycerate-independent phosphoglycerate mutase [Clostridioides sp.]|nr:2,3-bisphosphoglycerate-independent phosphoglycerate mutase [Clostridioides sp.]
MKKPVALIIMDGFGCRKETFGNAVREANTKNLKLLSEKYPKTLINASGLDVGLPYMQMGNSEVGHTNIGAGRIVYQDLTRISKSIKDGDFFTNQVLVDSMKNATKHSLHVMGLLSDGGVHSHIEHLEALLLMAKKFGVEKAYIHIFTDGRDTDPKSAINYASQIQKLTEEIELGKIATVSGRYYAMDRDKRWERVKLAYDAIVNGKGNYEKSVQEAIIKSYENGKTDEFIEPTVIDFEFENKNSDKEGLDKENLDKVEEKISADVDFKDYLYEQSTQSDGVIKNGDSVIFFNFRPDRARELTRAIVDEEFEGFEREYIQTHFVCMTKYDETIKNVEVAFKPQSLDNTLGEYISKLGLTQLRAAETEKYAHVTFFFNGGVEEPNENEDRLLIASPKVATYDLQPEMSAYELTEKTLQKIEEDKYDFIVINYANPDMVGHTGMLEPTIKAVETVDDCVGQIIDKILQKGGSAIITADHGNAEYMVDEKSEKVITAHSTNQVPFILVGKKYIGKDLSDDGKLSDIAPTILDMLDIDKPKEMTGKSLIK